MVGVLTNKEADIARRNVRFDVDVINGYVVFQSKHITGGDCALSNKVKVLEKFAYKHNGVLNVSGYIEVIGGERRLHVQMVCDCVANIAFDKLVEDDR